MVIYKSLVPSVPVPNVDLYTFLLQQNEYNNRKDLNKALMVDGETGQSLSWKTIKEEAGLVATGWTENVGLKKGETVAVFAPNQLDHAILYLSVLGAQCVISPGNPAYTEGKKRVSLH